MIILKIDTKKLDKSMREIAKSLDDLPKSKNMSNIARASSSIAAKKFVKDVNAYARTNKKAMHHVYEWGAVGQDTARLFRLHRNPAVDNRASIDIILKKSGTKAPIARVLSRRGPTGKSVTRSGIFKNKAMVMEMGQKTSFVARRTIAFSPDGKRIVFRPRGTSVTIKNPGGRATTGSLTRFAKRWETSMLAPAVISTGIFNQLNKAISRTMSKNVFTSAEVASSIKAVCDRYDTGVRTF